ncbi:hypothetical protein CYG68_18555 [Morganella morganii]|uniref:DUF2919 domain-containing protein n=1 Tax=Morganella morganii TaxID=582 RepID=A0A8I0PXX6_MORMO|nr:DUF2919 family protein [Morganella morganii]MBE8614373.1 hypothetical protein [Morganella morganii]
MSRRRVYPEKYYDDNGELGVPFWFWLLLMWQMRAWWVTVFRVSGGTDFLWEAGTDSLWWCAQLLSGLPVVVIIFVYPYRDNPAVIRRSYLVLIAGAVTMLCLTLLKLLQSPPDEEMFWLSIVCFDVVLCLTICGSRHLRDVFLKPP